MDGFELFEGGRGRAAKADTPTVLISTNGNISLNQAAAALFDGSPDWVQLFFNPKKKVVALKPVEGNAPSAYKLRRYSNSTSRTVGAKPFFDFYGVDVSERRSVEAYRLDDSVAFGVDGKNLSAKRPRRPTDELIG
jgi:hypothetical protein